MALVVLLVVIGVLVRLPAMHEPLLEDYPFRQTQTAYTALIFHQQGINLLAPQLPVLGSPWQVPFEFPLFQAAAALIMDAGVSPDTALRITGLLSFVAAALALWGLVRRISTPLAAGVALLVFLVIPFDVFWSRTAMIDYMAVAFALGWAWAGMAWLDRRRLRYAVIAVVLGSLALLVKLPTALFWATPLTLYAGSARLPDLLARLRAAAAAAAVLVAVPVAIALAWTAHADSIKSASPSTAWLTTSALSTFNFGTFAQRLNPDNWQVIVQRVDSHVSAMPFWLFGGLCLIAILRGPRLVWAGVVLTAVLPILTFFNLFVVHDYYLMAITPAVAAVIGHVVDGAVTYARTGWHRVAVGALTAAWLGAALFGTRAYLAPIYARVSDPAVVLPAAAELSVGTRTGDLVVFEGLDWSSAVPYYSRRTGMMLPAAIVTSRLLDGLPAQGYHYLFAATFDGRTVSPTTAAVLQRWPWFAVISAHLFEMESSPTAVRRGQVLASSHTSAPPPGASALRQQPLPVLCDGSTTSMPVPAGADDWLELRQAAGSQLASLTINGVALPAEPTVVFRGAPGGATAGLRLTCAGATSLTIVNAYSVGGSAQ